MNADAEEHMSLSGEGSGAVSMSPTMCNEMVNALGLKLVAGEPQPLTQLIPQGFWVLYSQYEIDLVGGGRLQPWTLFYSDGSVQTAGSWDAWASIISVTVG